MRLLLRLAGLAFLSVAVIMATLDATRSVAASSLVLTPLADSWTWAFPGGYAAARAFVEEKMAPVLWDPVLVGLLALPGWLVFLLLAFVFHAIGQPRARRVAAF